MQATAAHAAHALDTNDNVLVVRAFLAAWSRLNPNEISAFFTDDAVYHNIPMQPVHGRDQIATFIARFVDGASDAAMEIINIAAAGQVVLAERIDRFTVGGKAVTLSVAGVFELVDGQIAAWRDYFDLTTWVRQQQP